MCVRRAAGSQTKKICHIVCVFSRVDCTQSSQRGGGGGAGSTMGAVQFSSMRFKSSSVQSRSKKFPPSITVPFLLLLSSSLSLSGPMLLRPGNSAGEKAEKRSPCAGFAKHADTQRLPSTNLHRTHTDTDTHTLLPICQYQN